MTKSKKNVAVTVVDFKSVITTLESCVVTARNAGLLKTADKIANMVTTAGKVDNFQTIEQGRAGKKAKQAAAKKARVDAAAAKNAAKVEKMKAKLADLQKKLEAVQKSA